MIALIRKNVQKCYLRVIWNDSLGRAYLVTF